MLIKKSSQLLIDRFESGEAPIVTRAPGRVNLIGEHTDYNGGYVLPFAIDRTTELALRPRDDLKIRVYANAFRDEFRAKLPLARASLTGGWGDYLIGVLIELSRFGKLPYGFDGAITGNVPMGAGLSSSAALEIALAVGLTRLYKIEIDELELVKLCQRVENEFIGTKCGIMDQYASYFGREGNALLLDTSALVHRYIPLCLRGTSLFIVDSRVQRTLGTSGYNERRRECEQALEVIQTRFPERKLTSLSGLSQSDLPHVSSFLPPEIFARVRHVVGENARVLAAVEALEKNDHPTMGRLLFASHASLRDLFEVSTPELDFLVDWA
ncbi:MAG: galactokinase, partial [candidate division WOR-3 bacterium]|nr:galactokinase [candidate division WOR-3 bacterium]